MNSASPPNVPTYSRKRTIAALVAAATLIALVGQGLVSRAHAYAALKTQTQSDATTTVSVIRPTPGPALEEVVLPGQVKGVYETPVYARTSGYIKEWKTDIGTHVTAGQLLAVIDSPEVDQQLRQAEADLRTAQANAAVARSTANRVAGLVATESVSRQEGEDKTAAALAADAQVAAQEANVARLQQLQGFERVVAPFSGVITARSTDVGALINAGDTKGAELFRIADTSKLRTYVDVPQSYAGAMAIGTKADLQFPDRPGKTYAAVVARTAQAIDPTARTLSVELDIDNAAGELFPGSFTEVHFELAPAGHALRVPGNVLLFRADGTHAAVVDTDGHVNLKSVTLGRDFGSSVEVLTGLTPVDRVIINPPAATENGDQVRVAVASAKTERKGS